MVHIRPFVNNSRRLLIIFYDIRNEDDSKEEEQPQDQADSGWWEIHPLTYVEVISPSNPLIMYARLLGIIGSQIVLAVASFAQDSAPFHARQ